MLSDTARQMLDCSMVQAEVTLQRKVQGHVGCGHCKGTGFRAGWMEPGCPA